MFSNYLYEEFGISFFIIIMGVLHKLQNPIITEIKKTN